MKNLDTESTVFYYYCGEVNMKTYFLWCSLKIRARSEIGHSRGFFVFTGNCDNLSLLILSSCHIHAQLDCVLKLSRMKGSACCTSCTPSTSCYVSWRFAASPVWAPPPRQSPSSPAWLSGTTFKALSSPDAVCPIDFFASFFPLIFSSSSSSSHGSPLDL